MTKSLTIQGAGIDSTNLTCNNSSGACLKFYPGSGDFESKLTGFTFKFGSSYSGSNGWMEVAAPSNTGRWMRVTGNKFTDNEKSYCLIFVNAKSRVLVDNNTFANKFAANPELIELVGGSADDWNSTGWSDDSSIGTANNVFIEDCTFTNDSATQSSVFAFQMNYSGRVVFRHNTITNLAWDCHGAGENTRGGRSWEIYNNSWTYQTGYYIQYIVLRGGTGVVYSNTRTDNTGSPSIIAFQTYNVTGLTPVPCCCGYPTLDQIGCGKTTGTIPTSNFCNSPRAWSQASEPAYFWSNTLNGSTDTPTPPTRSGCNTECGVTQYEVNFTALNTDYFNSAKPGYTPYTYPHPLRKEPSAPKNLRMVE
jgi:hypothetical protein